MAVSPTKTSLTVGLEIKIEVLWLLSSCATVELDAEELANTALALDCDWLASALLTSAAYTFLEFSSTALKKLPHL